MTIKAAFTRRLLRDQSAVALLEFAFALPIVLGLGIYGIEMTNLALANLRVSQIALNLADNASRVGAQSNLATVQLREVDLNDVLSAARQQGAAWQLTTRGRVTISSLEADSNGVQRIHWQRCAGLKSGTNYDSSYGKTLKPDNVTYDPDAGVDTDNSTNDNSASHPGTLIPGGMGDTGFKVTAPASSAIMFVEINYDYSPVVSSKWVPGGAARIHYIASFIVRDRRDFSEIYNPTTSPVTPRATCDVHAT